MPRPPAAAPRPRVDPLPSGTPQSQIGGTTIRLARAALALYWPALAVSTHWRHLQFHPHAGGVSLEEWLHPAAFALLALLMVGAGLAGRSASFLRHAAVGTLLAAVYAPIDELTQAFVPGRDIQLSDLVGNWAGVAVG